MKLRYSSYMCSVPLSLLRLFQFSQASALRRLRKKHFMNVLRRIAASFAHHDVLALGVPFQYRSGADAEFATNLGRNRDLTLRRNFGLWCAHRVKLPG